MRDEKDTSYDEKSTHDGMRFDTQDNLAAFSQQGGFVTWTNLQYSGWLGWKWIDRSIAKEVGRKNGSKMDMIS
jgi:hypothetical protein